MRRLSRFLALAALALTSCPDPADQFVSGRLLDPCNGAWPVCNTTAGCFVGNAYYLEGQFPGTRRFVVRTQSQAAITIAVFLKSQGATGEKLRIEWNDSACGTKTVEEVDGKAFFKETEAEGSLRRTKNVYRAGDHLIEVSADCTGEYLLKAEVSEAAVEPTE